MASQDEIVQSPALPASTPVASEQIANVEKLHMNAIGVIGLVAGAAGAVAPMAAMFFNVPNMVTQAGAAVPLAFLISAIGMVLFGVSIVYFSRRISSAGGLYTWVSHSLGKGSGFYAGWLMLGGYALFEAASAAAFGGLTDNTLSGVLHIAMPGGWVTYALLSVIVVSILTYFDVKWSVRVLAPFLALEVLSLLVLDVFTIVKGGAQGQDLVHTFTAAGTALHGVFPGGVLGVGVAMALGVWSFVGGEQGVAFGEEVRFPKRAIPWGLFGVFAGVGVLFVLTTYAAVIGEGWQKVTATNGLGNIAVAPQPYFDLASRYVGGWLVPVLYVTISTSTFAAIIAFHNGMVRYLYSFGREAVLPRWFGKTHPRWHSPYTASLVQSLFSVLVVLFLALIYQRSNPDGSTAYAFFGGNGYQQTNGILSYGWLAIIGTISFIIVYIMVNISAPVYARRHGEFNWLAHVVAPLLSSVALLIPLASFVLPAIPGPIGTFATGGGLFPTPFPLNLLPLFPVLWIVLGWLYSAILRRTDSHRFERLGRIVRGDEEDLLTETEAVTA